MTKYRIEYCVGNTYKYKIVFADSVQEAVKKSRLTTSVTDIEIVGEEYYTKDKFLLRDF